MMDKMIGPAPEHPNDSSRMLYPDLKALREARGLSLQDIYESTRISVANLDAIENGRYHLLPVPAYTRAFIRSYALAIGAESDILLAAYETYLQSLNAPTQEKQTGSVRRETGRHGRWVLWITASALVVVAVIMLLSRGYRSKPEMTSTPPVPSVQAAPDIRPDISKPDPEKKYLLSMQAREPVWVRIRGDENRSEQMILQAGQTLERSSNDPFTVDIGNAGGLSMTFQGKPVGSIGKRGQVVRLRFPED